MAPRPSFSDSSVFEPLIRRLRLHSDLSDADAENIRRLPCKVVAHGRNAHLVREGDQTKACRILLSGFAHRFRITDIGNRQILSVHVPGDPIDFDRLFLPVADDGVQTCSEAHVAYVMQEDLRDLMWRNGQVTAAIVRALLVDASTAREWIMNIGQRDARSRISHLLCEITLRLEAQGIDVEKVALPLKQDEIADATGITPVHVNRTLKAMQSEGLIRRKGALVMLQDHGALSDVAGFDRRYLHLERPMESIPA